MTRYFVGLGSNLGDRLDHLRRATAAISGIAGVELRGRSGVWETRPLGPGSGPFLNAAIELVVAGRAGLDAHALLASLREIEAVHGRVRDQRWGDRTLDLDLLCGLHDGRELEISSPSLNLPHPEASQRDFVLQPLLELDAELALRGRPCARLLAELDEDQRTLLARVDRL